MSNEKNELQTNDAYAFFILNLLVLLILLADVLSQFYS